MSVLLDLLERLRLIINRLFNCKFEQVTCNSECCNCAPVNVPNDVTDTLKIIQHMEEQSEQQLHKPS
jgi:hypothetical protein